MSIRVALIAVALLGPTAAAAAAEGVCVTNGSEHRHLFAAGTDGGPREVGWLDPGETLCSGPGAGQGGVVSVFEREDALEGCSRLVAEGGADTLIRYVDFDRCEWASHGG